MDNISTEIEAPQAHRPAPEQTRRHGLGPVPSFAASASSAAA